MLVVVIVVVDDVVLIVRLGAVGLHIVSPERVPVYILVPFPSKLQIGLLEPPNLQRLLNYRDNVESFQIVEVIKQTKI